MGDAVLILSREGVQALIRVKFPSSCSAFQAEDVALRSALIHAMGQSEPYDSFEIFSNVRPLLTRILSDLKIVPLFLQCRLIILSMSTPVKMFLSPIQAKI